MIGPFDTIVSIFQATIPLYEETKRVFRKKTKIWKKKGVAVILGSFVRKNKQVANKFTKNNGSRERSAAQ
ncbi:MAG: hypothetical protein FWC43_01150 [Planctomycetaceae bacterium]|nr:hypothetical protein [Planctomycetaceae bacterium]